MHKNCLEANNQAVLVRFVRVVCASLVCAAILGSSTYIPAATYAQTVDPKVAELQKKIEERNRLIAELEKEIKTYQNQVTETSNRARTLQNALNALNASINKLSAETKKTESNIVKANYTIQKISHEISEKEQAINRRRVALQDLLASAYQARSQSLLEIFLNDQSLSDALKTIDSSRQVQSAIQYNLNQMYALQKSLSSSKNEQESQKSALQKYQAELTDKKKLVETNKREQDTLLKKTKGEQTEYQKLLNERLALRKAFEAELRAFEADLKYAIDPNSIPRSGTSVLSWPADNVRITQLFGDTAFSRANALVYNGRGHNGIDLGMPIGTPIKAAANGRVGGAGDTDTACPNASYGKWIFIEHPNGLSTLYAHLSLIKVSAGQTVQAGDIIGYSGNTGYSTGPHLHFTVFASQGVKIQTKPSAACGTTYTMPIADLKAYLNPMLYLPPT